MTTTEKTCFKCGTSKAREEFYPHPEMADGLLGKCKRCTMADVRANRAARLEYYQKYDRLRSLEPHRKAANTSKTNGASRRAYVEKNPQKTAAHNAMSNAIRDGKIHPEPCVVCGRMDADGHHFDYSRPLDVIWLCRKHHAEHHRVEREIERMKKDAA